MSLIEKKFVSEVVAAELVNSGREDWWLQNEIIEKLCMQIRRSEGDDTYKFNQKFILKSRIHLPFYTDVKQAIELNLQK